MRILTLELIGYIRLKNKGVNRIHLTFTKMLQIIVGPNGSCKTSLMRECSPLPPDNKDYLSGGLKKIVIEKNDTIYTLISHPGKPSKHEFIVNNEDLNTGGTLAAQKMLVEQYFKYTQDIHELLLGTVNGLTFSSMTPTQRRELIMKLYPHDLTLPMKCFAHFKKQAAYNYGGIKTINQQLTEEYQKRKEGFDPVATKMKLERLSQEHKTLLQQFDPTIESTDYDHLITSELEMIERYTEQVKNLPNIWDHNYKSIDVAEAIIRELDSGIVVLDNTRHTKLEELDTLDRNSNFNTDTLTVSIDDLKSRKELLLTDIKTATTRIDQLKSSLTDGGELLILLALPEHLKQRFMSISNELIKHLTVIPENKNRLCSIEMYKLKENDNYKSRVDLENTNNALSQLEHKLTHILNADKTICPKCNYEWIPGISDNHLNTLKQNIEKGKAHRIFLESNIKISKEFIDAWRPWYESMSYFKSLINQYPDLSEVWAKIIDDVAINGGGHYALVITEYHQLLIDQITVDNANITLTSINKSIEAVNSGDIKWHKERRAELEKQISVNITAKQQLEDKRKAHINKLAVLKRWLVLTNHLEDSISKTKELMQKAVNSKLNQIVSMQARDVEQQHRELNTEFFEQSSLESVITGLELTCNKSKENYQILSAITKALSPTEGFIAEQLSLFITTLVGNVNSLLKANWREPIYIKPCVLEGGELNYRFPVVFGAYNTENKDIVECSTGETQIIDWAWRVIFRKYLGLEDMPLYMDEIGANFDESNRNLVVQFVKNICDSGEYSQIFLISHYIAQHGALSNSEICALSTEGITMPKVYNEHVLIE